MQDNSQGPPRHGYTAAYPELFAHVCPEAFFGPQIKISLRIIVGHNPGLPSRPSAFEESARVQVAPVRGNLRRMPGFHEASAILILSPSLSPHEIKSFVGNLPRTELEWRAVCRGVVRTGQDPAGASRHHLRQKLHVSGIHAA